MNNPSMLINRIFKKDQKTIILLFILAVLAFLVFFNITNYPKPWFDEGSHLHVPKTLVQYGVYADLSSEGFRYYGPTIGVGPTVMLPIALMFKLFGIGLLQARLVVALYSLGAILVFFGMVRMLSDTVMAGLALLLMLSSRSVLFLDYGRQVLGEVPGFFFLILGIFLWFKNWENSSWKRLVLIGLLFGFSMITKYQYLLFLIPMIGIAWLLNIFYYRTSSHKNFIIPGLVAGVSFGIWQIITILSLGPSTALENLALLRTSAEGVAFSFNLSQISSNIGELTNRSVYLGALIPGLIFGFTTMLPKSIQGQKWSMLYILMGLNLGWYVVASIGWIRYAFLGLALSSIFIARFFYDLTGNFKLSEAGATLKSYLDALFHAKYAIRWALVGWLVLIVIAPLGKTVLDITFPGPNEAQAMAAYLNENVPKNVIIETWEPEMGFLTDHNYHYPPNPLLAVAIKQVYSNGEPVQQYYDYVQTDHPDYLLVGVFSKWVNMYPLDQLSSQYELVASVYNYDLYERRK